MRIALFTETFLPKVDGIVNTLCHLLDHLAERGHASLLFAPQGAPARYAQTPIIALPAASAPYFSETKIVSPFVDVRSELQSFQPDLVHLVNPICLGVPGLNDARQQGIPVVASYQTDLPGFAQRWGLGAVSRLVRGYLRWLHNQCDLNLTPSRFTQCELLATGYQRVQVWTRGVDTTNYHPRYRTRRWRRRLTGNQSDAPLLLYVGRLAPEKRSEWLRPVLDALPHARLAIVGDGPSRGALERLFAGTPTVFTGYLRGKDLARAYASADVFAFPAANETLGNVVLEAMASGLPIVAPRSGGLVDHVRDGVSGLLVDAESESAFVAAISRLVNDLAYARDLGAAGRRYVETRTCAETLDGLLQYYAELVERKNRRRHTRASVAPMSGALIRWLPNR